MFKKIALSALGMALLVSPLAVSAQSIAAYDSTSTNASLIVLLQQLIQVLEKELQQLFAMHDSGTGTGAINPILCPVGQHSDGSSCTLDADTSGTIPNPILCPTGQHSNGTTCVANSVAMLTATPSSGAASLTISFTGTGVKGGSQYIIDYGDGSHSDALAAIDVCMHLANGSGGCPKVQTGHAYTSAGTYTATLQPYVACMWSNPRCMIATIPLAQVTVTVSSGTSTTGPMPICLLDCAAGYHPSVGNNSCSATCVQD